MAKVPLLRPALAFGVIVTLAACEDGDLPAFLQAAPEGVAAEPAATRSGATTTVERDVEAPDVFQATEAGLWDGRPSLGGVWVAHPDVREPERVLIRNEVNGNFVIGALFRRERDNPGPRLQVSSDAADALGMLAGQPVRLNVTALRREEAEPEPTPEPMADEPEAAEEEPVIQRAEPEDIPAPTETVDIAAESIDPVAQTEPEAEPKKGFFATLFAPKPKEEDLTPLSATSLSLEAPPDVETASLDAPAAPPPPPTPVPVSRLEKPFIQIGIFSVEKNANDTAASLRRDGIVPTVLKQSSSGKTFWRVVVGPANTTSERSAILDKVKALGYADAYFVTN